MAFKYGIKEVVGYIISSAHGKALTSDARDDAIKDPALGEHL